MSSAGATLFPAEALSCPACASNVKGLTDPPRRGEYCLCRCSDCGLLFSSPMLAADAAWYSSSWLYGLRISDGVWADRQKRIPWNFSQALSAAGPSDERTLLDVGCAEGHFLHLAQNAGFRVTGLDFNFASLKIAREVFGVTSVHQSSAEEFHDQNPDLRFDVVTIFEVLEHVTNPSQVLRLLNKLLRPGGKLMLSVPGNARWPAFFHPEVDAPPHHLTLWSHPALKAILEGSGFQVLSIRTKPLGVDDIGIHLKWRAHSAIRTIKMKGNGNPRAVAQSAGREGSPKKNPKAVREVAEAVLSPLCWALRLHPRAGGFTLFAECIRA